MFLQKFLAFILILATTAQEVAENNSFPQMLGNCKYGATEFDACMKTLLNELRKYYKTGFPEFNIRPFDPHTAATVEQRRGDSNGLLGYKLILRNVSEYGWINSRVTKFKSDPKGNRIIYSQYFPEKSLDGYYEFSGGVMGSPLRRKGVWNLTLYDYSQTTTVRRLGGPGAPLKVNVVVDKIGNMNLHISDFFGSQRQFLNGVADTVINNMWSVGLPVVRPLINDLVSTAFTEIFNNSFRHFPWEQFIKSRIPFRRMSTTGKTAPATAANRIQGGNAPHKPLRSQWSFTEEARCCCHN